MSARTVYRVVIIADQYSPEELVSRLLGAGVQAGDIHLSRNQRTAEMMDLGVRFDVPSGMLELSSYNASRSSHSRCGNCTCATCWPVDARVP